MIRQSILGLVAILILCANNAGAASWMKTYGGAGDDYANAVQQTSDGGYIVAGSTNSFHTGAEDAWVLKLAGSGDVQWQKTYGGAGIYQANSIEQTSDGGYIVAGNTTRIGAGWDFWVSKLTSGGDVQWQKTYGGTNTEVANSIQQTSDGGYIVAGMTEVSDGDLGSYDFLVLKLTSSGDIEWQKTSGSTFSGRATSIQQTSDGGNIVAGHNFDTGTTLNVNAWVLKFDEGGNFPNCSVVRNIAAEVNNSNAMILNTTSSIANTAVQSTLVSLSVQDSSAAVRDICPEESLVPIGTILDWWRPNASWPLPAGYMICDGSAVDEPRSPLNGMKLPDLTGKFILGVTDINSIGIAGGNSAHRHQVPLVAGQTESKSTSHHHRWIKMQVTPLGDKQYISWRNDGSTDLMSFWKNGINDEGSGIYPIHMGGYAQSWYTEDAVSSHSHEFTVPSHETDSSSNLPPYVGLLKIMRIW